MIANSSYTKGGRNIKIWVFMGNVYSVVYNPIVSSGSRICSLIASQLQLFELFYW